MSEPGSGEYRYETSLLRIPQAVLKHVLSRDFTHEESVHGTISVCC